jgi:hypothetical protein
MVALAARHQLVALAVTVEPVALAVPPTEAVLLELTELHYLLEEV